MGMTGISKSQVSRLCEEIDDKVGAFLERPIEGDWPYLWIDATYVNVREAGRIVSVVRTAFAETDADRVGLDVSLEETAIGAVVALSIWSAIDDPTRFAKSASVGAYFGLTPRRYASGEIDRSGRISKCGDRDPRTHLYEAANVLLTRISRASALRDWGLKIAKRSGSKKAKVAVVRKMAGILHRMWIDGTEFRPGTQAAVAQVIGGAPHPTSSSPPGRRPEQGRSLRCCPRHNRGTNADTTLTRSSHPRPCCGGDPDHVENHEPGGDVGERA